VDQFGDRLLAVRLSLGLTQQVVSDAIGISMGCLSRLENGKRFPLFLQAYRLAVFYGCSLDYLAGRSESVDVV
jgi:transcriptional regulator with XRE-family HTH domain